MRRALAWESIGGDPQRSERAGRRLQAQPTQAQLADARDKTRSSRGRFQHRPMGAGPLPPAPPAPPPNRRPRRLFGSVEIDMVRPVRAFDAILNAVVMELQRTKGAKVKPTPEIEADAEEGFSEADIGVIRDNARQLKFRAESTGFE